jgi:flavin reductase (DIM6/NTAB) family NADH-FMN oxidoreductase RutF
MYLSKRDIEQLPRVKRLNIINSVTGIKPANLIGTQSADGQDNLAIFSSVVHLGSNPALIGLFFRPQHEKPRDTYLNIKSTGVYTINQVPGHLVENAHFTSAKFPNDTSEFERCGFSKEHQFDFEAPFVKESQLKMGLELVDEVAIKANKTILMIGSIQHLLFSDDMMDEEGNLNMASIDAVGISGVNSYYSLERTNQFPYAHLKSVPDFKPQ